MSKSRQKITYLLGTGEAASPTSTSPKNGTSAGGNQADGEVDSSEKKPGPSMRKNGLTKMADDDKSRSTEEAINTIRAGWTCSSCNALTIGELYLMVSLVRLMHSWLMRGGLMVDYSVSVWE